MLILIFFQFLLSEAANILRAGQPNHQSLLKCMLYVYNTGSKKNISVGTNYFLPTDNFVGNSIDRNLSWQGIISNQIILVGVLKKELTHILFDFC